MSTKTLIKSSALSLFNSRGVSDVSIRSIGDELGKSHSNITYHFATKEDIVIALYTDYIDELKELISAISPSLNGLEIILRAPFATFDLSIKYLFLFRDYVELRRSMPRLVKVVDKSNIQRKNQYLQTLQQLQQQGIIRAELNTVTLDYLMELSGMVRTYFFMQQIHPDNSTTQKQEYISYTNQLLVPYLTAKGMELYNSQT